MSETGELRINRDMSLRARFHRMPPKRHDRDPQASEVLAHIREVLGCEMDRALKAFNSMRNRRSQVLVFDNVEKTWAGCFWTPSEEQEKERKFRRELMALERDVAALKADVRKLRKEVKALIRAAKKADKEEGEVAHEAEPSVPQGPQLGCNPGHQSREFRRMLDEAEAREQEAKKKAGEKKPWERRMWMGCCDACGSSALNGAPGEYVCGECGLDYQDRFN